MEVVFSNISRLYTLPLFLQLLRIIYLNEATDHFQDCSKLTEIYKSLINSYQTPIPSLHETLNLLRPPASFAYPYTLVSALNINIPLRHNIRIHTPPYRNPLSTLSQAADNLRSTTVVERDESMIQKAFIDESLQVWNFSGF